MDQTVRKKLHTHTQLYSISLTAVACLLTRKGCVSVQLAHTLLQQTQAESQHGRVVKQVKHDAVSGGFVCRDLLSLQLHSLLDKIWWLRLVVPQQLVEHLQDRISYLPLRREINNVCKTWTQVCINASQYLHAWTTIPNLPEGIITFSAGQRYALVGKGRNTDSRKKFK